MNLKKFLIGFLILTSLIGIGNEVKKEPWVEVYAASTDYKVTNEGIIYGYDFITKGPWVDGRAYATLEDANTAAYSADKLLIIAQNYTLTANTTLTAAIKVIKGSGFTKASDYSLTINGSFEAGHYQVFFEFDGTDIFGLRWVNVKWFGAKGDNSTTGEELAINKAVQAGINNTQASGRIYSPAGIYKTSGRILIEGWPEFYGDGRATVFARTTGSGTDYDIVKVENSHYAYLHDFTVVSVSDWSPTSINGLHVRNSAHCNFRNIYSPGVGDRFAWLEGVINSNFENVQLYPINVPGLAGTVGIAQKGLFMDQDTISGVSATTTCVFTNCTFDTASNIGVQLVKASVNTFIGTVIQNSVTYPMDYGVHIADPWNFNNVFINTYFGEGAYGIQDIYDKGNRTRWINNRGTTDASLDWANYGDYKYYRIHPDGNFGMEFFDIAVLRTGANKLGLGSQDTLDLATNKNMLVHPVANPAYGTTVYINLSGANGAKHHIITVTDNVPFTIEIGAGSIDLGQEITITVYNNSGGTMGTITWNAGEFLMSGWSNPGNGKKKTVSFYCDATNHFIQLGPPSDDL